MNQSRNIGALVAALPEQYQPIFANPEMSDGSSRGCEDRLVLIRECARQLRATLGRPLRVLDLGCAQGFFSLSLAADGHTTHGVDFLDLNVHVCDALAEQNPGLEATFEHSTVEDVIERLEPSEYDLVLGLSVFHHLVHARDVVSVSELCRKLSEVVGAGIFELALREEPLYWASSLPQDPAELLAGYAFTRLLSRQPTHLSAISRPLIYASSKYWYVGDLVGEFTSWSAESHVRGHGTHQHSRRYYFGDQIFVKKMTLGMGGRAEINLQEFHNEVDFLHQPPASFPAPRLIASLNDGSDLYVARERIEGRLLSELIDHDVAYDADQVVSDLLGQLVALEQKGLYHNDVRCWNVLVSEAGQAHLIDYGAISDISKDCSWLEDLLLSFLITVREILERHIVSSNPGREPALDFTSLPPRYRNAFIRVFSLEQSSWTFKALQEALGQAVDTSALEPDWIPIYEHLRNALVSYNTRLGALYAQAEHDHVELAAGASALERVREIASQAEAKIERLKLAADVADERSRGLEESSRLLAEWAKDMEARAIKSEADSLQLSTQLSEVQGSQASLVARIEMLDQELQEMRQARERAEALSESLVSDVGRLTGERDELLVKVSDGQTLAEQHEATIHHLRGEVAALQQRIEGLEKSKAHDRRRLKELQADLSQGVQTIGSSRARVRELEMAVEVLEGQIRNVYASRSWRLTAPVRWFASKVLRRGGAVPPLSTTGKSRRSAGARDGSLPSPADVATDKRLLAVDQLASRIRKSKR